MLRKVLNSAGRVVHRRRHRTENYISRLTRTLCAPVRPASLRFLPQVAYADRTQIAGGAG